MRTRLVLIGILLVGAVTVCGVAAQDIPATLGWHELPGTTLQTVCPPNNFGGTDYEFSGNCRMVTMAWNSAVMDTRRNRLIVWGGGHGDYLGNEVYALDLKPLKVSRLTDPGCRSRGTGRVPGSHRQWHAAQQPPHLRRDRLHRACGPAVGGRRGARALRVVRGGTWTLDFGTITWEKRNPKGDNPLAGPGIVSAYDPTPARYSWTTETTSTPMTSTRTATSVCPAPMASATTRLR